MIELIYYENGLKKGTITDLDQLKNKQKWLDITNITEDEKEFLLSNNQKECNNFLEKKYGVVLD